VLSNLNVYQKEISRWKNALLYCNIFNCKLIFHPRDWDAQYYILSTIGPKFCLEHQFAMGVRMKSSLILLLCVHPYPQCFPKLAKKSRVPFRRNKAWQTKMYPYVCKEKINFFMACDGLLKE
jgi:hypothetical protein